MIRVDKRSESQIAELIYWVQRDEFWMTNVLSMDKLRDKFDQLFSKQRPQARGTQLRPRGCRQLRLCE